MRTVEVEIKTKITMIVDEGVEIGSIIDELEYDFTDTTSKAIIEDTEILDYEVIDSK